MVEEFEFGRPGDESEVAALAAIVARTFNAPLDIVRANFEVVGEDSLRVVRHRGQVVGGLKLIMMGQWFGGRSVPTAGISVVGVLPEARGTGAGRVLMRAACRELADEGVPLSTLFPATVPLYRSAGYEIAGGRYQVELPLGSLVMRPADEIELREAVETDVPSIKAAYATFAATQSGLLDRGDYVWKRVLTPRQGEAKSYVAVSGDDVQGSITLYHVERSDGFFDLVVTDVVANSEAAGRRLLAFLATHRSLSQKASLNASPWHPLFLLLREWGLDTRHQLHWMLRLTDVRTALEGRGYPAGLSGELHLEIVDEEVPANHGRWTLTVEGGRGQLASGGRGSVRLHARGLATLYTGFQTAEALAGAGRLDGAPEDLAAATAFFASPAPWMPDIF